MKRISSVFALSIFTFLLLNFSADYLTDTKLIEQSAQAEVTLVLGNPSNATSEQSNSNNFLVAHSSFILSYNKERGGANWVSWHLSKSDIGDEERTNAFAPDTTLPRDWWIKPTEMSKDGYDRGHLCPSEDRTDTSANNEETFLMSNMIPQTVRLNRGAWKSLETYAQKRVKENNEEAYIIAGCYGDDGRIGEKVTVPTNCYKIIVLMRVGRNDLRRINNDTRVIAVDMENIATLKSGWRNHRTTVDDLEEKTGYDFLSTVSEQIQSAIEARKDNN